MTCDLERVAGRDGVGLEDARGPSGTAMAARIRAGITVQTISIVVLPWIWRGSASVGLPAEAEDGVDQRPLDQDEDPERPVEGLVVWMSSPMRAKSEIGRSAVCG